MAMVDRTGRQPLVSDRATVPSTKGWGLAKCGARSRRVPGADGPLKRRSRPSRAPRDPGASYDYVVAVRRARRSHVLAQDDIKGSEVAPPEQQIVAEGHRRPTPLPRARKAGLRLPTLSNRRR